ncbi:uncharacterized protein PV07_03499 [Cladophialophora immunda]|uniref:Uncharacterized protein n=1 Tax=Cladophialophora immunda TaxID=569365 RepID=A0A0D2B2L9_9EURO|nr:uncharacterized protein PV07_03499 [Cladophialophora immunda]KIW31912.1 hypothetical protein PV07_03499 [Cladophialophora immunda]
MCPDRMAGDYIGYVESLRHRYPNLRRFCDIEGASNVKNKEETSRVVVIEIRENGISQKGFDSADDLERYMQGPPSGSEPCKHRVYVLEGTAPAYLQVLGRRLRMDPFVFAEQLMRGGTRKEQAATLPSQHGLERCFSMQYVEARVFPDGRLNTLGACCLYRDRKIWATKINSKFDEVAKVHRIASFWSRKEANGAFNGLILVDPPVGQFIKIGKAAEKEIRPCQSSLYQGGYVDISPFPCALDLDRDWESQPGPTRESLFDDILFYWNHMDRFPNLHSSILESPAGFFDGASFFLKSIIAANWMQFLVYFDEIIDRLEYSLARADINALDGVENHLVDVTHWHRRCWKSCEQVEHAIHALQPQQRSSPTAGSAFTGIDDFVYIHRKLCALTERCQRLSLSLTHVISVIQSRQASEEAHSLKILTLLGMLFVPLTFLSGIFSMSGDFLPGERSFWIYIVVSIPAVIMVFLVVFSNQVAQFLKLREKPRKSLLNVRLTARPPMFAQGEAKDAEKG